MSIKWWPTVCDVGSTTLLNIYPTVTHVTGSYGALKSLEF